MSESSNNGDPFYVGYRPLPSGHKRMLMLTVPVLLIIVAIAAFVLAQQQGDPGPAQWTLNESESFEGDLVLEPYAMLRMLDNKEGGFKTALIVLPGKFGAKVAIREKVEANQGFYVDEPFNVAWPVRLTGTRLQRNGRTMIELSSTDAVKPLIDAAPFASVRSAEQLGRKTMQGEIIDPKCFLGAMKPGSGKTHKACAALCLRGGIPPMFVSRDKSGNDTFFLLIDPAGAPILESVLPFVGEPVQLQGDVERYDDLWILRLDAASIERL